MKTVRRQKGNRKHGVSRGGKTKTRTLQNKNKEQEQEQLSILILNTDASAVKT